MRPHVCIPSGCQQWVSKTVAVGVDRFAYMSSLAIYVYSSVTFLPVAILAKHEQHLSALCMSPFNTNLLACAMPQEVRVYDVDTELPVAITRYVGPKANVAAMEWHRSQPHIILLAIGSRLFAWDISTALDAGNSNGGSGGGAASATRQSGNGVPAAAPPSTPPTTPPPARSVLSRLRGTSTGGVGGSAASGVGAAPTGRWVHLREMGGHQVTAFDQCGSTGVALAAYGGGGADGGAAGGTLLAVGTTEGRVVVLELEPSGMAVRGELRSILLSTAAGMAEPVPSAAAGFGAGAGSGAAATGGPAAVSAVCWEPLSGSGLLLTVTRAGAMALYDVSSGEAVLSYVKQPATAARFLGFVAGQPGNFLLSSSRSGALQQWNVSQPAPLRLFKLGGGLVQGFAMLSPPAAAAAEAAAAGGRPGSAASGARRAAASAALVSFNDGGLCVYDLATQQVLWRQEGGHTETIFDCRFCSTDPNLLATASFDSSVRVWDVRTARCVRQLTGGAGVLYSVSWSADGRLLAASSDTGAVHLYDYARGMLVRSLQQHTKQSLRVAFHPQKPNLLASSSLDGSVLVYTTDGEAVRTLRHASPVSCIAWCVLCPQLLATTSEEGAIHVWDVSRPPPDCRVRTLERHASRVFGVEFSPLLRHHLLSSSNDHTARVWDVSTGDCLVVLQGHSAEVRAVAWHPEVAHICYTGSWDASIRVWDARTGRCLHVCSDHHADVYGLATHPARPFFLVSCSRDTTLRLWSAADLTPHLLPQALLRPLASLLLPAESAAAAPEPELTLSLCLAPPPALLSGAASRELAERLGAPSAGPLERLAALTAFFMPPACMEEFWELVRAVRGGGAGDSGSGGGGSRLRIGGGGPLASAASGGGGANGGGAEGPQLQLHHWSAAKLAVGSAANHLELAANSKGRVGSSGRREELLLQAAQQHLLAGNVEHCCELLAELGQWERALALAPVVGLAFWQRLLRRRVEAAAEEAARGAEGHVSDVLPLYLVSGQVPALVDMLAASQLYDTAFNVAAVHASGGYARLSLDFAAPSPSALPPPQQSERGYSAGSNGAGSGGGSEQQSPLLLPPPSPRTAAAGLAALAAAGSSSSGLEHMRPTALGDIPSLGSLNLPPGSPGGAGVGGSVSGSLLTPLPSPSSSLGPLPPVNVRGGTLPSLGMARTPSLRAPPLALPPAQLQAASASTAPTAAPPPPSGPLAPLQTSIITSASAPNLAPLTASREYGNGAGGAAAAPTSLPTADRAESLPLSQRPASPPQLPPPPSSPPRTSMAPAPPSGGRTAALTNRFRPLQSPGNGALANGAAATPSNPTASSSAPGSEPLGRAVAVRCAQARELLSAGLPLQAACCALSVDDVAGAVGLLLRGGQEEMALALLLALSRPASAAAQQRPGVRSAGGGGGGGGGGVALGAFGVGLAPAVAAGEVPGGGSVEATAAALLPRVLVAAAQRREAAGDYLTAAELIKQVPGRSDLRELLAGRCRAHTDPATAARVFAALDLNEPASYDGAPAATAAAAAAAAFASAADASGCASSGGWDAVRSLLLGGGEEAAAEVTLAGLQRLVESGRRVTLTCPEWEQAWSVLNSLSGSALGGATWCAVFPAAAYLGGMAALEAGCPAEGLFLLRRMEAAMEGGQAHPVPVPSTARLAAEVSEALDACLALPAWAGGGGELRDVLAELLAAAEQQRCSAWMQGMLRSRLAAIDPSLAAVPSSALPTSPRASSTSVTPADEDGPLSPSDRRHASAGRAAASSGGGLRLGLDLRSSSGRLAAGGTLANALAALPAAQPAAAAAAAAAATGGAAPATPLDLARGPVVVAAAHVPSRSSLYDGPGPGTGAGQGAGPSSGPGGGSLPRSAVSGGVLRGAAVLLDDGRSRVTLSEAVALRRVMAYGPLGTGRLLRLP